MARFCFKLVTRGQRPEYRDTDADGEPAAWAIARRWWANRNGAQLVLMAPAAWEAERLLTIRKKARKIRASTTAQA